MYLLTQAKYSIQFKDAIHYTPDLQVNYATRSTCIWIESNSSIWDAPLNGAHGISDGSRYLSIMICSVLHSLGCARLSLADSNVSFSSYRTKLQLDKIIDMMVGKLNGRCVRGRIQLPRYLDNSRQQLWQGSKDAQWEGKCFVWETLRDIEE